LDADHPENGVLIPRLITGGTSTRNETQGETRRQLIEPSEVLQDLRADEQIIIRAGSRPIRCGRAIYFRRPAMAEAVAPNRFYQAPTPQGPPAT
jgi:type IV secretion system protein VirD4